MRILFLHSVFPGPFRNLAAVLAANSEHTVLFLAVQGRRGLRIPGVRRLGVGKSLREVSAADPAEGEAATGTQCGAIMANAMLALRDKGFKPDIVIASAQHGALYVRDVFPSAFFVAYADWFYTKGANYTFFAQGKRRSSVEFAPYRIRNMFQANALLDCDLAITSSVWQREQYPTLLHNLIEVWPDGVDTTYFSPGSDEKHTFVTEDCNLSHVKELVTFSGRGTEPFRGFPQFCKALPRLLAARPDCHVLIMAGDAGEDLARACLEQVGVDTQRVHFLGFRPYEEYRMLLRASSVHVYLTAPFALSSGLFEAMSCGCLVVGSDTPPVRELIEHGTNGFLCDFWDTEQLADMLTWLLAQQQSMQPLRNAARQSMLQRYDSHALGKEQVRVLEQSVQGGVYK